MLVSSLVDEVTETFRSYVREQNPTTALTDPMDDNDTTFTVDDATKVSAGLVQIDDEMVYVRSVDRSSDTVTLEPWGRGQSGSTAAAHSSGAKVTSAPTYPRSRVRDVISAVLSEIFPQVFAVSSTLISPNAAQINYDLPADCYRVLSVHYNPPGPTGSWIPLMRWRQNLNATDVELELFTSLTPGTDRVRVMYIKEPPSALAFSDDLETMGYPFSIRDLIIMGGLARLVSYTEPSRIQTNTVEGHARSEAVPAGSAMQLGRYLYQLFRSRLDDEARNLQQRYPTSLHFTR